MSQLQFDQYVTAHEGVFWSCCQHSQYNIYMIECNTYLPGDKLPWHKSVFA